MADQDAAESKAEAAALAIGNHAIQLWNEAHRDGVRNGLELAAVGCEAFAHNTANNYELEATVRDLAVLLAQNLRDQIRLFALQVPDPEVPNVDPH